MKQHCCLLFRNGLSQVQLLYQTAGKRKHGYIHRTVNHSKEFANETGDNTNKIEGHWRQAKCKLPKFGVRKHLFSTYLAEFMWRYMYRNGDLFAVFLNDVKKISVTD